jgi:hypothetical protein
MGFNMVDRGKTRDKVVKVAALGVFNTEVVDNKTESDGTGGVAKETRSRGLDETARQEKFDKLHVRELTCLLETV